MSNVLFFTPTVCTARQDISIPENNEVGAVVETITVEPDVTLAFNPDTAALPFRLEGNQLIATERFDYEVTNWNNLSIHVFIQNSSLTGDHDSCFVFRPQKPT